MGCLWKTHEDDNFSVTYNSIAKSNKSVIIGAKKTNLDAGSSEKPRLHIKTSSPKNPHIRLQPDKGESFNLQTHENGIWFSNKPLSDGYQRFVAIGSDATASDNAIAIGGKAGKSSVAVGYPSTASGDYGVVVGANATAGSYSAAYGAGSNANSSGAIAIGYGARANGKNAIAIGNVVAGENEVKLGTDSHKVYLGGCEFNAGDITAGDITADELHVKKLIVDEEVVINGGVQAGSLHVLGDTKTYNLVVDNNLAAQNGFFNYYLISSRNDGTLGRDTNDDDWRPFKVEGSDIADKRTRAELIQIGPVKMWLNYGHSLASDRRLKNVGEVFTAGLEEIKKLEVFNYVYKKDSTKTPHVGVMAQDLMKIFPNAVFKGDDGFYRIRMEDMFYALVNAVKELDKMIDLLAEKQKEIDTLRAEVKSLKKDYADLEIRIEKLEKRK